MGVPSTATGTTLAPPTTTTIAMDTVNITHTTAETEVTELTTATVTTPESNLITTDMTAADTTTMKRTTCTIYTITAMMVRVPTTVKAIAPAPALTTTMMAAADTQAMKRNMDVIRIPTVETIVRQSMADTTMIVQYFYTCDQVKRKQFDVQYHPGQENLGDYNSKHHEMKHHKDVRPIYLHMQNSPHTLQRAMTPSSLRGCVRNLRKGSTTLLKFIHLITN